MACDFRFNQRSMFGQPRIVAFGFRRGSGKDEAGRALRQMGATPIAFADPVKKTLQAAFGFDEEQLWGDKKTNVDPYWGVAPSTLMQVVGTDLFRDRLSKELPESFDRDVWIRRKMRPLISEKQAGEDGFYVVTDLRFPNEARFLKENFRTALVHVHTPEEDRRRRRNGDPRDDGHVSEVALQEFDGWDYRLHNTGDIDDLHRAARQVGQLVGGTPPETLHPQLEALS